VDALSCKTTLKLSGRIVVKSPLKIIRRPKEIIMDWFIVVFGTFKVVVLGTGMFFAIKWHYDQDKKKK
jgi:hypothetical protein